MKKKLLLLFLLPWANLQAQTVCAPSTGGADLDINNVKTRILGGGDMWWNQGLQTAQYEVPKGSGHHTMFAGSIWLGGLDIDNTIHIAAQTYRQTGNDLWPGPLNSSGLTTTANCQVYDRVWKVNKSEIQAHITNPSNPAPSIIDWPAKGNDIGAGVITEDMAPFVDVNSNGTYEPTAGDYPKINGDQALWYIINDAGNTHTETGGAPLGVEIQVMAYSFLTNNVLNNTTFYNYNIKNKSIDTYNDFYVGFWTDCDLGGYTDDFIGCDSTRNAAIYYNADASDTDYGSNIPITAIVGIKTPLENNISVKMSKLGYYKNDASPMGNPSNANHFYNYLKGQWKDGTNWGYNYAYPGSPCVSSENSMVHPILQTSGDLRTVQSFGPMTFVPGECKNITTAVLTTFNSAYPNPCFDHIKTSIDSVKLLHQSLATYDLSCQTIASLDESYSNNLISIYPNPATEAVLVSFSKEIDGNYKVFAIDGSEVLNGNINGSNSSIEVSNIKKGLYFISILDQKGQLIAVKKMVKE
jgi:hypothetical protein